MVRFNPDSRSTWARLMEPWSARSSNRARPLRRAGTYCGEATSATYASLDTPALARWMLRMCNPLANTTHLTFINGHNEDLLAGSVGPDYMNTILHSAKCCVNA